MEVINRAFINYPESGVKARVPLLLFQRLGGRVRGYVSLSSEMCEDIWTVERRVSVPI